MTNRHVSANKQGNTVEFFELMKLVDKLMSVEIYNVPLFLGGKRRMQSGI